MTGHDNGAGGNQHDIPCQDIVLSQNVWDSGDGHMTSGFSDHGIARPGATVRAFEGAFGGLHACLSRFAFNCPQAAQSHGPDGSPRCADPTVKQAFVSELRGINRPITVMFGPDDALYLVDFGAVRDFGQSDPRAKFRVEGDGPLVQIPGTGVIWKITRTGRNAPNLSADQTNKK